MKRILILFVITSMFLMMFCGCSNKGDDAFASERFMVVQDNSSSLHSTIEEIVVDTETGVLYVFVRTPSGTASGLSPLYNADGSLQLWDGDN